MLVCGSGHLELGPGSKHLFFADLGLPFHGAGSQGCQHFAPPGLWSSTHPPFPRCPPSPQGLRHGAPFSHTCHLSPRAGLPDGLPLLSPSASSLCTPQPAPDHWPSLCAATVPPATSPPEVECAVSGKCVQIFRNYTKKNRK